MEVKVRYFFITVLLVLGCRSSSMDVDVSFEKKGRLSVIKGMQRLRDDLNGVLDSGKSPICIMTVTRSSLDGLPLQPLKGEELNDVIYALENMFKKGRRKRSREEVFDVGLNLCRQR